MFKLLNRFAWFIALSLSFVVSSFFGFYSFYNLWIVIPLTILIKYFFLSENFIKSRLEFFAESIGENYIGKTKQESPIIPFIKGDEKIEKNRLENEKLLEEIKLKREEEKNIDTYKTYSQDYKEKEINKIEEIEEEYISEEPSKIGIAINKFFSENLLAKLGGILVFLGVLFLLSLIYSAIGPKGKLIIGFIIGFSIYFTGIFLDKKELYNESRILLGIGILINYLVILGGRYLIGDSINNNLLSDGTTFLFLIFNTVFAVVTALLYKSKNLLLFSFIFAFINPILIGLHEYSPYTTLGYSLIVGIGAIIISIKEKNIYLAIGSFILSNILFLISPLNFEIQWITALIFSSIIGLLSIYTIYKIDKDKLPFIFGGSYLYFDEVIYS